MTEMAEKKNSITIDSIEYPVHPEVYDVILILRERLRLQDVQLANYKRETDALKKRRMK